MVCGCHRYKAFPVLSTGTSLNAKNNVIVCIPFVMPDQGEKIIKKFKLCSQSLRAAHCSHITLSGDVLCSVVAFSLLIMLPWYF